MRRQRLSREVHAISTCRTRETTRNHGLTLARYGAALNSLNRTDDAVRDLVLNDKDVGQVPLIALRPDMAAGSRVDELGGNADAMSDLTMAALNDIARA